MIEWLKNWTNSIIVAVIIAIIFELIIPNSNNKKYIKMVINLYVLFVILNPVILKFTNLNTDKLLNKDYEKYFSNDSAIDTSVKLDAESLINSTAENTIKQNIKEKLKQEGYKVNSISIDINNDGQINKIKFSADKDLAQSNTTNSTNNSSISINKVDKVNISENNENKKSSLRKSDIQKIKKILKEEYEILEENIEIN